MLENEVFDLKIISLVKVAEETNQTEYIFKKLNQQYVTEEQQNFKMLSTIMEPIIILVIGFLLEEYFDYYNHRRRHQSIEYQRPKDVYRKAA